MDTLVENIFSKNITSSIPPRPCPTAPPASWAMPSMVGTRSVKQLRVEIRATNFPYKKKAGWWQLKYFLCSPLLGEDFQFDEHIFQLGWNHQLEGYEGSLNKPPKKLRKTSMTPKHPPWIKMYFLLKRVMFQCHVSFQGSTHFEGIKECKYMVVSRDFPYNSAVFALGNIMTPEKEGGRFLQIEQRWKNTRDRKMYPTFQCLSKQFGCFDWFSFCWKGSSFYRFQRFRHFLKKGLDTLR